MDFITDKQFQQLLKNGSLSSRDKDNYPVAKLYAANHKSIWLLIDIDPDDKDFAFALYDCGNGFPEFKYVSLPLLKDAAISLQWDIKRDEGFDNKYPISVYAKAARQCGYITGDENILDEIKEEQRGKVITSVMTIEEIDILPRLDAFFSNKKAVTDKTEDIDELYKISKKLKL